MTSDNLLTCLDFKPDGLVFEKPIKVTIPVNIEGGDIPFIHEIDVANGTYKPAVTEVVVDSDAGTIEVLVHHFSSIAAEIKAELKRASQYCEDFPCRCQGFSTRQSESSIICELEECQNTQSELYVDYTKCGGYTEVFIIQELSKECIPKLVLSANKTTISTEESCEITAKVKYACGYQGEQKVDFTVASLGQVSPESGVTEVGGGTTITFTAGEDEGTATITAATVMKYVMYNVYVAGGGLIEAPDAPVITKGLTETIDIKIEGAEKWSGTLSYTEIYIDDYGKTVESFSGDISFSVFDKKIVELDTSWRVIGTADLSIDEVTWISYCDDTYYENFNIPSDVSLLLHGCVVNTYLGIEIISSTEPGDDYYDIYTFDYCIIDDDGSVDCLEWAEPVILQIGSSQNDDFREVSLIEGTYVVEYSLGEYSNTSYTITLKRDN